MAAALELQKAVFTALGSDVTLTGLLGGARSMIMHQPMFLFPISPSGVPACDWGTATEDGNEHLFSIHVWSRPKANRKVAIMDPIRRILLGADTCRPLPDQSAA